MSNRRNFFSAKKKTNKFFKRFTINQFWEDQQIKWIKEKANKIDPIKKEKSSKRQLRISKLIKSFAFIWWGGQKMSDWNWTSIDNRCNSLQNNAIHNRFGFQWQLFSLHFTGNKQCTTFLLEFHTVLSGIVSINVTLKQWPRAHHKIVYFVFLFTLLRINSFRFMSDNCHSNMKRLALKLPNKQLPKKL